MKGSYLGEFEEIVLLAVCALEEKAYGISITNEINEQIARPVHLSGVHTALYRLEEKGLVKSQLGGATNERGGRRKRFYSITSSGKSALIEAHNLRKRFWMRIPFFTLEGGMI